MAVMRSVAALKYQQRLALLAIAFLLSGGGAALVFPWLLVLWIVRLIREHHLRWVRSPLDLAVAGFLLLALIAGLRSPMPAIALESWLLTVLSLVIVLQTILDTLHEVPHFVRSLHKAFALGTLCAAIYGLLVLYVQHTDRAQLPALGGNALGFGLMVGVFLTLPLLREVFPWSGISAFAAIVGMAGLIATFSRGALYGLAGGGAVYLWLGRREVPFRVILAVTLGLVLGAVVSLSTPFILKPLAGHLNFHGHVEGTTIMRKAIQFVISKEGNSDRLLIWSADLRVIRSHPWFGVGQGVFPFIIHRFAPEIPYGTPPHNIFLNVAAEVGIPGAVVFLAMPVIAIAWGLKQRNCYRAAQVAVMVGMMASEIRDHILTGFHMFLGFILLLGMLLAPVEHEERTE
jgi:putative inorganic carbon (HCO3(-)) transporter